MTTKGYGLTVHDIDMSCPADLEPYSKAFSLEQKNEDSKMWMWWGNYGLDATMIAIERCFAGEKAKLKYFEKPLMAENEKSENSNKESKEEVAVYEMKRRIRLLRQSGLPESPD